jgi:hypothetical protein
MRRGADGAIVPGLAPEVYAAVTGGVAAEPPSSALELVRQGGVPTFLIRATEPSDDEPDRAAAAEVFSAALPAARVHVVQGCCHDLVGDLGTSLGQLLAEWLNDKA